MVLFHSPWIEVTFFFMELSRIQPGQALSIMTLHYACGDLSTPNLCFPSCHLNGKLGFLLFSKNPWIICRELCTLKLLVSTWLLTDTGTDSVSSSLALRTNFSDFFFSFHSSSTVKALGSVSKPTTLSSEGFFQLWCSSIEQTLEFSIRQFSLEVNNYCGFCLPAVLAPKANAFVQGLRKLPIIHDEVYAQQTSLYDYYGSENTLVLP